MNFDLPIHSCMRPAPARVRPGDRLQDVEELMNNVEASGVPVVDEDGRAVGVITRTDLLRVGTVEAVTGTTDRRRIIPNMTAVEVMTLDPIRVDDQSPLSVAVGAMRENGIHRVLATNQGRLSGIVTTWDVLEQVAAQDEQTPLEQIMSSSIVSVDEGQSVAHAVERMENASVRGLVVLRGELPVGVFDQKAALVAKRQHSKDALRSWINPFLITAEPSAPCSSAARMAVAANARYIICVDDEGLRGLVTATDMLEL